MAENNIVIFKTDDEQIAVDVFIAVVAAVIFGAYKLFLRLNIEYEYIITNGTMDIDKIIAKSSRKRILSFDISSIQRIEKFTGVLPNNIDAKYCFFCL